MTMHAWVDGDVDLTDAAARLESAAPETILEWALETYAPRITLACSFGGPSGMVVLDMAMRLDRNLSVFYLDTELLFPETYQLVEDVSRRYGITPRAVRPRLSVDEQAAQHGDRLWARDPNACCALRKVATQHEALAGYDAWITGLRRDQSPTRRATPVAQWDRTFGLAKVNPLAQWTESEVWAYVNRHDVPYNALHDRGYPSIGCTHCTRPVQAGADPRSGRWSGFDKTECGLHLTTKEQVKTAQTVLASATHSTTEHRTEHATAGCGPVAAR